MAFKVAPRITGRTLAASSALRMPRGWWMRCCAAAEAFQPGGLQGAYLIHRVGQAA